MRASAPVPGVVATSGHPTIGAGVQASRRGRPCPSRVCGIRQQSVRHYSQWRSIACVLDSAVASTICLCSIRGTHQSPSAQVQECPQADEHKPDSGYAFKEAWGKDMEELCTDEDREQAGEGERPCRGDKHPEATQVRICREEQCGYLGFVAEFC